MRGGHTAPAQCPAGGQRCSAAEAPLVGAAVPRRGGRKGQRSGTGKPPVRLSLATVHVLRPLGGGTVVLGFPQSSVPLHTPPTGPSRGCGRRGGTEVSHRFSLTGTVGQREQTGPTEPVQWGKGSIAAEAQCRDSPEISTMLGSRFSGFTFPSFPVSFFPVLLGTCL